jgi:tRNA nucleotidyltransferase (CCA-adding enzyme)
MDGELIYTPEEFYKQRNTFSGVSGITGQEYQIETRTEKISSAVSQIAEGLSADREKTSTISTHIIKAIEGELNKRGLLFENSITGLEGLRIEHIGSTSRSTHVIGASDFDFSILLDRNQLKSLSVAEKQEMINNIIESIGTLEISGSTYGMDGNTTQMAGSKIKLDSGEVIEFDLAITDKGANLDGSNSHEYVIDRLNNIRETEGEEKQKFVIANIIFAKKFLKAHQCYKKKDKEGGMGGIGIENWILQHNGNFEEATKEFLEKALREDGSVKDFETFKSQYTVYDPGKDIRSGKHDNFVANNMTSIGYQKMVAALIAFRNGEINPTDLV